MSSQSLDKFKNNGIINKHLYTIRETLALREFLYSWICTSLLSQGVNQKVPRNLAKYHDWARINHVDHRSLFSAKQRFCTPSESIRDLIINDRVKNLLSELGFKNPKVIDEGMGWLGYRIIRPGMGDGYPLSCKDWGASSGAYSFWVPLFGFGKDQALHFVGGSHLQNYKNFLPREGIFTKDELRIDPSERVNIASRIVIPGNCLFYHPRMLHTENVVVGNKTRLNLEFRFKED
jgi:hypothetical protein